MAETNAKATLYALNLLERISDEQIPLDDALFSAMAVLVHCALQHAPSTDAAIDLFREAMLEAGARWHDDDADDDNDTVH